MCSHANASAYSLCIAVVLQKYFVPQLAIVSIGPTYYVSVCIALVILQANRKFSARITLPFVTCLPYIYTLSRILHDFMGEKIIECRMCVLIFCTAFVWNISHSKRN